MSLSDIKWSTVDVGLKEDSLSALAYLGPLGPDGVNPASTLTEGEHYSAMIVISNKVNSTGHCVVLSQHPDTGVVSKQVVPCPIPPSTSRLTATRIGDSVYVFGGMSDGSKYLVDLHCYSITGERWDKVQKKGRWPCGRRCHSAITLGGKLYIVGGFSQSGPLKDCWCYDPKTEEFSQMSNAPLPFFESSSVVVGDRAHLIGSGTGKRCMHLSFSERGGWVTERDMPFEVFTSSYFLPLYLGFVAPLSASFLCRHIPPTAVSIGTDIVVVGGNNHWRKVHIYDTLTKGWREGGDIPVAFDLGRACHLSPSRIVVHSEQGVLVGKLPLTAEEKRERERAAAEAARVERVRAEAEREERERLERERQRVRAAKVDGERRMLQSLLASASLDPGSVASSTPIGVLLPRIVAKIHSLEAELAAQKTQSLVSCQAFEHFT
ncbi:hypothetical protein KIPB_011166, partial [Kipferlia bialata]|eukprot:g11166.t1